MEDVRTHGSIGTLTRILSLYVPPAGASTLEGDAKEKAAEASVFALASLTGDQTNRSVLLQDSSFMGALEHLLHPNEKIAERVAWILGNLALDPEGRELICTNNEIMEKVINSLESKSEPVLSSALRVLLALARQPDYHPYIKAPDPSLSKLKALKQFQSPKISQIASKLVEVLSKA